MDNADREVLQTCISWLGDGHAVDLVTVAKTWGSSPKPPGSLAAVRDDGVLVGSVSGGCVEKQLAESFQNKGLNRVHSYHVDDDQARRFGMACGGELELVFESLDDADTLQSILHGLEKRQRMVRSVHIASATATVEPANSGDQFEFNGAVLKKVFGPEWRVLLVGAGQLSRYVAMFALATDFEVLVCDPRPEFKQAWNTADTRMLDEEPHDAVLNNTTDAQSAVLALTHDPNLDDIALIEALPSDCFFVGALGSKRNYEKRCKRLAAIIEPEAIARLHSPVGLPIKSRSSAEIAVSIVAQLVQKRAECQ